MFSGSWVRSGVSELRPASRQLGQKDLEEGWGGAYGNYAMKTVLDIPEKELKQAIKNAGVKNKDEAVLMAVREFNRRRRLSGLAARLKGSLPGYMGHPELKVLREDARWEAAK